MAASSLLQRELTRNELCNLGLDSFDKIRRFKLRSRRRGDMLTVIRNVRRGLSEDYLSRRRVRHDALEVLRTGSLSTGCVPELPTQCRNRLAVQMDANDAAAFSLTGNLVDSWSSSAGSVPITYTGSGTARPDRGSTLQNGLPVVTADGVDDFLSAGSVAALENDDFTMFAVVQKLDDESGSIFGVQAQSTVDLSGAFGFFVAPDDSFNIQMATGIGAATFFSASVYPKSEFFILSITKNGVDVAIRKNGVLVGTSSSMPASIDFTTTGTKDTTLFAVNKDGSPNNVDVLLKGNMGEFLLYNVFKDAIAQAPINAYLNAKWGLGF